MRNAITATKSAGRITLTTAPLSPASRTKVAVEQTGIAAQFTVNKKTSELTTRNHNGDNL